MKYASYFVNLSARSHRLQREFIVSVFSCRKAYNVAGDQQDYLKAWDGPEHDLLCGPWEKSWFFVNLASHQWSVHGIANWISQEYISPWIRPTVIWKHFNTCNISTEFRVDWSVRIKEFWSSTLAQKQIQRTKIPKQIPINHSGRVAPVLD